MDDIIQYILFVPLTIIFYLSGFLFWPIRRWMRRKQKQRSKMLGFVFFAQLLSYIAVACYSQFITLEHFYYWFIVLIGLNFLFTVASVNAWVWDARYESRLNQ